MLFIIISVSLVRRQAENAPELNTLDSILKSVEQCSTDLDLTKVMSLVITFKFYTNNDIPYLIYSKAERLAPPCIDTAEEVRREY